MRNRPSIREKYRIDVLPTVTLLTLLTIDAPKLSLVVKPVAMEAEKIGAED